MAEQVVANSLLGNSLQSLLNSEELQPGDDASYQLCKLIYLWHPLGAKMVDAPITMAQSQKREISIPKSPEERVREAFEDEWKAMGVDAMIANVAGVARTYGVGSIVYGAKGIDTDKAIEPFQFADLDLYFNIVDPLNTSGSLVLNQDPNAPDFLKVTGVAVSGQPYHRSRACVLMNEKPVYIAYTTSAFGYVGRSVYQRALYPLKSFVQSMITDDMVTKKAGLLIAKIKQPGSIIDNLMSKVAGLKRQLLQSGATGNVLSIAPEEDIQTLNMMNLDGAAGFARNNILKNIATAGDMPASLLNQDTLAEGFGEGTEDAKNIARYIDRVRIWLQPIYDYFDDIVMYRAWNPEFYKIIQGEYPAEYGKMKYKAAFYQWKNSFRAEWPNLLKEPDSELAKVDDIKLKAIIAMLEVLMPEMDPENKTRTVQWAADNFNELKLLFPSPLLLDYEALESYVPPVAPQEPGAPKPEGATT